VRSADRVPLNWKRPPEWDRFLRVVEEEHDATALYAGFEIEQAWKEYRDEHPAEDYANRLARAVGTHGRLTREKTPPTRESDNGGRRVSVRVRETVKEDMAAYAKETGVPNYEILRAVVCWYLDGGLLGRLTERLERAVPKAEDQLAALDPGDDREFTAEERKPRWLASRLTPDAGRGAFTADDFGEALEAMPYRGGDTPHMREKWLPEVLDRLDYTRHPNNPDLFVPEEQAREFADNPADLDAPAVDRLPYGDLSDEERVEGLRIEAVRKAGGRTNGLSALSVETVRDDVFDGGPSKRKAKALMDEAARTDGFSTDARGGQKRLKVDLSEVDRGLLSDAGLDMDGSDATGERDETDEKGVDEQMDALMNATAVTDGGREEP